MSADCAHTAVLAWLLLLELLLVAGATRGNATLTSVVQCMARRVLHKGRREIAVPLSQFAPLLRPAFDVVKTAIAAFKALPKGNKVSEQELSVACIGVESTCSHLALCCEQGQEQMRKFWTSVRPAGGSAGTAGAAP